MNSTQVLKVLTLLAVLVCGVIIPAKAQQGHAQFLGTCPMSNMTTTTLITPTTCILSSFTGTGSDRTLTISAVTGYIPLRTPIAGTGVPANTILMNQLSGTPNGAGTYATNNPTTSNGASLTIGGIPVGTDLATFCVYVQGVVTQTFKAPTSTPGSGGKLIPAGTCLIWTSDLVNMQFIQQAVGALMTADFYLQR